MPATIGAQSFSKTKLSTRPLTASWFLLIDRLAEGGAADMALPNT